MSGVGPKEIQCTYCRRIAAIDHAIELELEHSEQTWRMEEDSPKILWDIAAVNHEDQVGPPQKLEVLLPG